MKKAEEVIQSSLDKKREQSRRKILDASMELFYIKGYNETTTRDIITKAGILNGSLYNRFDGKEDILRSIVAQALNDALAASDAALDEEKNPLVSVVLPGAMELYAANCSPRAAELLYEAHKSWPAVEEFIRIAEQWAATHLSRYGFDASDADDLHAKFLAIVGALGNMVGYYAHGGTEDYRHYLGSLVAAAAAMMHIPVLDLDKTVAKICTVVEDGGITICGHELRGVKGTGQPQ